MCDATFTFGQRGSHFYQCPSRQDYTNIPKKLRALITSSQLQTIHHVTLGFENSFLITWRDKSGYDHIESQELPTELTNFLYQTNPQGTPMRHIPTLRLTLGPQNTSFYIQDAKSCLWMNLPSPLLAALQSRIKDGIWTDAPRIVALGAEQDFLLITKMHAAVWELGHYRTMSQMLEFSRSQDRGIEEVYGITLHAYRYQCFVAQSRNGTLLFENVPPHELVGTEGMRSAIAKDTKEAEWRPREHKVEVEPRRPSLQPQMSLRKEWDRKNQEFSTKGKGMKLSLSLSLSVAGVAGSLGKMIR